MKNSSSDFILWLRTSPTPTIQQQRTSIGALYIWLIQDLENQGSFSFIDFVFLMDIFILLWMRSVPKQKGVDAISWKKHCFCERQRNRTCCCQQKLVACLCINFSKIKRQLSYVQPYILRLVYHNSVLLWLDPIKKALVYHLFVWKTISKQFVCIY